MYILYLSFSLKSLSVSVEAGLPAVLVLVLLATKYERQLAG